MDDATQMLVDGIQEIEDAVGATITWNGNNYPCAGGPAYSDKSLSVGGFKLGQNANVVLRAGLFANTASRPQEEQSIIYKSTPDEDGTPLRIKSINTFRGALLLLECLDQSQGA